MLKVGQKVLIAKRKPRRGFYFRKDLLGKTAMVLRVDANGCVVIADYENGFDSQFIYNEDLKLINNQLLFEFVNAENE